MRQPINYQEEKTMKHLRLWVTLGIVGFLAAAGLVALPHVLSGGDQWFGGGSYLITLRDLEGNFASRQVITLHADQTMSVVDSGQDLLQQRAGLVEAGRPTQDSRENNRLRLPAESRCCAVGLHH